jgi:23S rRNA (cytosine1962-C5)-methyltransferase
MMTTVTDYELIDFGGWSRLERFGEFVIERPAPTAHGERHEPGSWAAADLRFDRDRGWSSPVGRDMPGPWSTTIGGLALETRPTDAGHLGIFPEHASMLGWVEDMVGVRLGPGRNDRPVTVLSLFAHTGMTTLALARAGASVVHVDSSRPAVEWARRNAVTNELADRAIRWLVDDARDFVAREVRRDRRYDGIVLDPPTYGHGSGARARAWRLERDLPGLLAACRSILAPDGFVLLTAHSSGLEPADLSAALSDADDPSSGDRESGALMIETADGRALGLGAYARRDGGPR